MPVDRPTFSESWYRVAELKPRLRSTAQVYRQHFRGQTWHVLRDPSSNQFSRLSETAYHFVGMLDGKRTVSQVWDLCCQELADGAPTQGEAIQLLAQLYGTNMLQADLPPDAQGLFSRYKQRRTREVQGYLMNLLFARIPLLDPDRFLERWVGVFGRVFSWYGFVVWLIIIGTGLTFLAGRWSDLGRQAGSVLDPANLPLLTLCFWIVKAFHELGHAFACKKFGKAEGTGGEVHAMGIMLLVFMPLPYVDDTSSWALRKKWRRAFVAAAGMYVELAIAAIAAIVWSRTSEGALTHALAYNVMFIASVATLLFNANPLLRFDGYYILSDLLEIPNLQTRGKQYLYYLVKKFPWGVRNPQNPAHSRGEAIWFVFYGIASTLYRVFISVRILLFIADKLFLVGAGLAITALIGWVVKPIGKFIHYLGTSGELARVRPRAVGCTLVFVAGIIISIGLIPRPDHSRVEGIAWPRNQAVIYAETDGFIKTVLQESGTQVVPGQKLVQAVNPELIAREKALKAKRARLQAWWLAAQENDIASADALAAQVDAIDEQIADVALDIESLTLKAPIEGTWIAPGLAHSKGAYMQRGQALGLVAKVDDLIIRATAGQRIGITGIHDRVEIRVKGRPDLSQFGTVERTLPAGLKTLPSAALGYAAEGSIETDPEDPKGLRPAERIFEIRIAPDNCDMLLPGQRVIVRLERDAKPLMVQWWRSILQLVQKRFHI